MQIINALILIFFTSTAHATGSPLVLYLIGGEILAFLWCALLVAITKKAWKAKGIALLFLLIGAGFVVLLSTIPNYLIYQNWIDGASAFFVLFAIFMALRVLRRS